MVPLKQRHPDHTPSNRPTSRARYAEDSWANLSMPLPNGNPMARRRFSTRKSEVDLTATTATTSASDRSGTIDEAQAPVTRYYAQAKELDDQLATVRQERNGLVAKIQELQASHEKQLDTLIVRIDEQQKLIKRYQSLGDVDELEHLQDDEAMHGQQLREYKDRVLRLEEELAKAKDLAQDDRNDILAYENLLVERNNQINTLQTDHERQVRKIAELEQCVSDTEQQQVKAGKSNETVYAQQQQQQQQQQQLREYKDRVLWLEEELSKAKKMAQNDHDDTRAYQDLLSDRNSQIDVLEADKEQQARKVAQLEQRVRDTEQHVKADKDNEMAQTQQLRVYKDRVSRLEEELSDVKTQAEQDREDLDVFEGSVIERNEQMDNLKAENEELNFKIVQLEQRVHDAEKQTKLEETNYDDLVTYKNLLNERNSTISTLQTDNDQRSRNITWLEHCVCDMEQHAREEKRAMEGRIAEITKIYREAVREAQKVTEELQRVMVEKKKVTEAYEEVVKEVDELRVECQRAMTEKKKIANELERVHSTAKHAEKKDDIINTLYAARSNLSRELTETASHLNHMADEAARREQQLLSMEEARRKELNAAKEHNRRLTDKIGELEQIIVNYERQHSRFGKLEKQFQDQNAFIDELQDALHEQEERIKEERRAVEVGQDDLAHSKEALDKALLHIERLEHELNALNEERRKKTEQITRLHSAVADAEGEKKNMESELISRQQELNRLNADRDEATDLAEQAKKNLTEAHRTIENLEKHLQATHMASRVQEEERVIRIGQLERSVERILEDLELTRKQLGDVERVRGALQEEVRRLRAQVKEHEDQGQDRARLLARSQRKLAALQEENKNWLLQLQQAETEAVRLRQVLGELTKYGEEALAQ